MTTTIRRGETSRGNMREEDGSDDGEMDDAELLAQLDDDFELSGLRERRLEELRREAAKTQQMALDDHGRYVEIKDEKKLIQLTAKAGRSVVHFFHPDFERCKTMDTKLEALASQYFQTLFVRVDVANVPWLVEKLHIKVLPCVVGFLDGVSKERIVGFEGIAAQSSKEINMAALESRLKQAGIIKDEANKGVAHAHHRERAERSTAKIRQHSDGESDWDD